jgi:N-acetyl-gamma-glutamyl-phosphate reductase
MKKIFIDGSAGTTGLRIRERLAERQDIELITLSEEKRKDTEARREALNSADIAFLCLPDAAAREAVALVDNPDTAIIDTSTAHRTQSDWAYGFPELYGLREKIASSKRIANPGCHASGFVALVNPLVKAGIINKSAKLTCFSITGYSGGGKKMIAEYEEENRAVYFSSPRQYALGQEHKHLKEMAIISGIDTPPVFSPIVADFYSGMQVSIGLHASEISGSLDDIRKIYVEAYSGPIVKYCDSPDTDGFLPSNELSGHDGMQICAFGNSDRIMLTSRFDNLGKGASGAAVQNMNILLGCDETLGLVL